MIEVELSRIIIDEQKKEQIVVLKEKNGTKMLPIIIGISEAAAIRMKLSGFEPPRPLTHDLLKNVLDAFDMALENRDRQACGQHVPRQDLRPDERPFPHH